MSYKFLPVNYSFSTTGRTIENDGSPSIHRMVQFHYSSKKTRLGRQAVNLKLVQYGI